MTSSVDEGHLFFVMWVLDRGDVEVEEQVKDVQWEPSDEEYEGDGNQQVVPPSQKLLIFTSIKLKILKILKSTI